MIARILKKIIPQFARRCFASVALAALLGPAVHAELYLNEIFFDPGGEGLDSRDEFIELRGTPGMSLSNHYLIFIENEGQIGYTGSAGVIENIFALGDDPFTPTVETPYTMGSNGFLTLRQKGNLYAAPPVGTTDQVNLAGPDGTSTGYGSGPTSSIRAYDQGDSGVTENSGFTLMLIQTDGDPNNAPMLGFDLDVGNDGLDLPTGREGWEIVDSIGVFSEPREAGWGRTYAKVNFGPEIEGQPYSPTLGGIYDQDAGGFVFEPRIEPGAVYVGLGYEIEYLGRWGNSTGQTPDDWHVSNLTDEPLFGSTGVPDFRQSGGFHDNDEPDTRVETSQGVPYGTTLVDTLGAPNLFYEDGDFDLDGDVDGVDFLTWQRNYGYGTGLVPLAEVTALRTHGDTNGDWKVDGADLEQWRANYGLAAVALGGLQNVTAVPEPGSVSLFLTLATGLLGGRGWKRRMGNLS